MKKSLVEQINEYTYDREIDYTAATIIGENNGIKWKHEKQLVEFKQTIDRYLKTFDKRDLRLVEMKIKALSGGNTRTSEEAEELTSFAATEKQMRKPKSSKNIMKKKGKKCKGKKVCESKGIKVYENANGNFDVVKNGKKIDELKGITEAQVLKTMGVKKN